MADSRTKDDPPTRVVELVVNLDDATGEQVGAAIDRLIDAGALDAWATPITMKKGRPAVMLSILAKEEQQDDLATQLIQDTGSFGVRVRTWDRLVLDRDWHTRDTRLGKLRLKAGSIEGQTITVKPEHDDIVALAKQADVALSEARSVASAAADALLAELRKGGDHA
ncbi:MAG: LarC family nickel insertion protein [Phycisphaeraceae bacterium]|nr:LarC family nickel insertion protein [Phycisphaeraceae bacterium]